MNYCRNNMCLCFLSSSGVQYLFHQVIKWITLTSCKRRNTLCKTWTATCMQVTICKEKNKADTMYWCLSKDTSPRSIVWKYTIQYLIQSVKDIDHSPKKKKEWRIWSLPCTNTSNFTCKIKGVLLLLLFIDIQEIAKNGFLFSMKEN